MSSFINNVGRRLSDAAKATSEAAKKAAAHVSEETKRLHQESTARPIGVKCVNNLKCDGKIEVPPTLWQWVCNHENEVADGTPCGKINEDTSKICANCDAPKPKKLPAVTVTCPLCMTTCPVHPSEWKQSLAEAGRDLKKAPVDFSKWAKSSYVELKSRPTTIQCQKEDCRLVLSVPPEVWAWCCDSGHDNEADATVCQVESCTAKRPNFTPVLTCQCGNQVIVPRTNIVASAKALPTKAAVSARTSYHHWRAPPQEFHCEHCGDLLEVPLPDVWNCPSCGAGNQPDLNKCGGCSKLQKRVVVCGACSGVSTVPGSNVASFTRSARLSVTKGIKHKAEEKKQEPQDEIFLPPYNPENPHNYTPPAPVKSESKKAPLLKTSLITQAVASDDNALIEDAFFSAVVVNDKSASLNADGDEMSV